ncbi:hypothetical protein AB0M41_44870, partial [Streptomyces sp. NPDC051896]|uniref:hypothetical protein n=1 Tax=Streptomyces sp. NPDC051896 TaxID=3155416 RepID=UPI003444D9CB
LRFGGSLLQRREDVLAHMHPGRVVVSARRGGGDTDQDRVQNPALPFPVRVPAGVDGCRTGDTSAVQGGYWQDGGALSDNLNSFNAAVRGGASLEEAELKETFTGKMAARAGFTKVETTELRGMPGHYTNVGVTFRR